MEENAQLQRRAGLMAPSTPNLDPTLPEGLKTEPAFVNTLRKLETETGAPRAIMPGSPIERRRDLLETLNTIAGIARALETKLKPQT